MVARVSATAGRVAREIPKQVADEMRALIVSGAVAEGESLGRENDLIERFGVSRPSLREALRILEGEGLVTVVRGMRGGVIAHIPDRRMTARTAALVMEARNVSLRDVFQARSMIVPFAARLVAAPRRRRSALAELTALVEDVAAAVEDPERFARAAVAFDERLVALAGNEMLRIVAEMFDEIVRRSVSALSRDDDVVGTVSTRLRAVRSHRRLLDLIASGDGAGAEQHWREHMVFIGKLVFSRT
jgi:GntR family transcriptional repressor for pyruvate dehydrogenase complex